MAYSEKITEDQLNAVRRQLSYFIEALGIAPSDQDQLAIGESFPLYLLPADLLVQAPQNELLSSGIQRTGIWYHQLKFNDSPIGYAKSGPLQSQEGRWMVVRVLKSSLADDVDQAINRIDTKRTDDNIVARLVEAPAYKLWAFFLNRSPEPEPEALVIRSPFPQLAEDAIYPEREFQSILLQIAPIVGVKSE